MVEENVEKKEVGQGDKVQKADRILPEKEKELAKQLDVLGWGTLLIWLGFIMLVHLDTGWILLGIGIIVIGVQFAKWISNVSTEKFWLVTGLLFIIGSVIDLLGANWLVPILLIAAGVALVLTRFFPRHKKEE